jgi:PKD repeat protein
MRLYKNNKLVINNKNGLVVKTITIYVTNATQVTNFEKFLTGYTYTKDTESFTITIEINSAEDITFTNPGSTTQIKGVEFGYEK